LAILRQIRDNRVETASNYNSDVDSISDLPGVKAGQYRKMDIPTPKAVKTATPAGIPVGSKQIAGKVGPNGRPVWQDPVTKKYYEE